MTDKRPTCPSCGGPVENNAVACIHCKAALPIRGKAGALVVVLGALIVCASPFLAWYTAGGEGHSAISSGSVAYMLGGAGLLGAVPALLVLVGKTQPAGFGPALLGIGAAAFTFLQVRNMEETIEKFTSKAVPLELAYGHYVAWAGCALLVLGAVTMRLGARR